jgi:cell shape-determining protein MreC
MQFLNRKKKNNTWWIILCSSLFVCIVVLGFFSQYIRPLFINVFHPVVGGMARITETTQAVPHSKRNMQAEIERLKKENEKLITLNANLEKEKNESLEWNALFGNTYTIDSLVRALIISKPNQSQYDTFIIEGGADTGAHVGSYLLINENIVLGTIDSIQDTKMVGILFSSPGIKTVGRLERSNYDVTLVGKGGGNMTVEIPKEIETALGDRVLFPAFKDTVMGIIRDISLDDRDATKTLYITLPTNILTLDHIYITK